MFYNLKNCLSNIEINYTVKLLGLRNSLIRFKKIIFLQAPCFTLKKTRSFIRMSSLKKSFLQVHLKFKQVCKVD